MAQDLAAGGFRVRTADLRGHGDSSPGWPTYSETAVAEDLLAVAEHLRGGRPAALVGNSYSGGAAVVAAAHRPDLVDAVGSAVARMRAGKARFRMVLTTGR